MNSVSEHDILNRLIVLHNRSLPMYLRYAVPWWSDRNGQAAELAGHITADQSEIGQSVGRTIVIDGDEDEVDNGEFPMVFTGLHDLSFDFLLEQMIRYQQRTIVAIERCVEQLPENRMSRPLAQEALGTAKAHLDSLCELANRFKTAS